MKKIFTASILLFGLTNTILGAASFMPPVPDPTELPPVNQVSLTLGAASFMPPVPDPTELPPVNQI